MFFLPNTPAFADKSEGVWGRLGRQGGSPGWVACLGWVARGGMGRPGWVYTYTHKNMSNNIEDI